MPLSAAIDDCCWYAGPDDQYKYNGGVIRLHDYARSKCSPGHYNVNHAATIVAFGSNFSASDDYKVCLMHR